VAGEQPGKRHARTNTQAGGTIPPTAKEGKSMTDQGAPRNDAIPVQQHDVAAALAAAQGVTPAAADHFLTRALGTITGQAEEQAAGVVFRLTQCLVGPDADRLAGRWNIRCVNPASASSFGLAEIRREGQRILIRYRQNPVRVPRTVRLEWVRLEPAEEAAGPG
jgi:hypothetical protein